MSGKELILRRFITGKSEKLEQSNYTKNTNFFQKSVEINNKSFNLLIVDTSNEEKYYSLTPIFYRGCKGFVIIFDTTNKEAFKRVPKWFHEVNEFAEKNAQIILVGTKIDLPNREVTKEEGTKLAYEYNCNYLEVNALLDTNINEIFYSLTSSIYQGIKNNKKETCECDKKWMEKNLKYINI